MLNMKRLTRLGLLPLASCALWLGLSSAVIAQTMRAHFIDVGQGAATLVEFPCAAILIDTGGEKNGEFDSTEALMDYLETFFARRADLSQTCTPST
jgi:beta-lactamase superfamily II metal-dependent hydrolase